MALQEDLPASSISEPKQMDPKEQAEREEAASAYAGESPGHFVDYCMDCVDTSVKAMLDIRRMQEECWRIFNEEEPDNWAMKEMWQSKITYPKPNKYVRTGQALARTAFDVDFLAIENERDPEAVDFWSQFMGLMVTRNYANFPTKFADATAMALAIGTSLEVMPYWESGKGLKLDLLNPENIHRDPIAASREPWSGRYWVHQEWQAYSELKKGEKAGIYKNIEDFGIGGGWLTDSNLTEEEIARRKNMIHVQGKYNNTVMVSEFWGKVLSPRGEELLNSARYTVAGGQVIRAPESSPYPTIRWPGVGFSALPNLRRFDGRGLLQGIRSLWYFANNLLSLHADNLNWVVNPMTEMNTDALVNPMDNDVFPGKTQLTYQTANGQPVTRTIERNTRNNDILAMLAKADMIMDDGSGISATIQGNPGYRSQITKGEAAQNLDQSNTLMGSIAADIEDGALNVITAMAETIRVNMTFDELRQWFPEFAQKYQVPVSEQFPTGLNLPKLTSGNFKIAGISAFMKHQENLRNLKDMEEMFQPNSVFLPFLKPYPYLKARVKYTNLVDIGVLISQEQADQIDQQQQQQQEATIQQEQQQLEIQTQVAAAEAAKHAAGADKAAAEAEANLSQADLFAAQAGQTDAQAAMTAAQPPAMPEGMQPPEGAI
ncbi:MAG: hypothetical protein WC356_02345 [Candidatus Micrarchaeia archaeon]|jgi:hypothetical protein